MDDSTFFLLIAWLAFSSIPALIAHNKGRSAAGWYFLSLLISPLLAAIILACLGQNKLQIEARALQNGMKRCPYCAELVRQEATICRYCQREQPVRSNVTEAPRNIELDDSPYAEKAWSLSTKLWVAAGGIIVLLGLAVLSIFTSR